MKTTPRIVAVPYRGLRCRELACQAELLIVETTRGRRMPLEREPLRLGDLDDRRGIFVVLQAEAGAPIAYGIRAAGEVLGLGELNAQSTVYRAHWAGCPGRESFRR